MNDKILLEKIESIKSKDDFVEFVYMLTDLLKGKNEDWENDSLELYLRAIAQWTNDSDGYYKNMKIPIPQNVDWKVFANILIAAKDYE